MLAAARFCSLVVVLVLVLALVLAGCATGEGVPNDSRSIVGAADAGPSVADASRPFDGPASFDTDHASGDSGGATCTGVSPLEVICDDGADDDCDGDFDCDDADCARSEICSSSTCTPSSTVEATCSGGVDDDCDSLTDCSDSDCAATAECIGCVPTSATETRCANGSDDDCDGQTDCVDNDCNGVSCGAGGANCRDDVCCTPLNDPPETNCADLIDGDCDGRVDCEDGDCDGRVCVIRGIRGTCRSRSCAL